MNNKISLSMARNFAEALLGILHGIPAARAEKERAEAALKWVEAYERYWEFLGKAGFSAKDRRAFIAQDSESRHIKELQEIGNLVDSKRVHIQLVKRPGVESGDIRNSHIS
jgi:hypothetical protein